ncbi:zinc ribbon domain-containing protein [Nodularia spumigena]|uniref:zinc ribbon domain-containing protein n=1 Tax=Nodularia spumigena TaxID=70799 RepID=UPI00129058DF|nr:hypothetical protein [Nodularia spumigena]MDB9337280.1 hypothetical protein [Nodularia spumigena CS-590/01]
MIVVDRFHFSSKPCYSCGQQKLSLFLTQTGFSAGVFGFESDRDLNGATHDYSCHLTR